MSLTLSAPESGEPRTSSIEAVMTSERASHANRRNAAKSTGPRTPSGKAQSKQNSRKHGLSIANLNPEMDSEIELLAELIAGSYGVAADILKAARAAAEAQINCERVQAFKSEILRNAVSNAASGVEAGQTSPNDLFPAIFDQLERLDRYEARALSRRKFAFRRFLECINQEVGP
jgi:hypothetical protein